MANNQTLVIENTGTKLVAMECADVCAYPVPGQPTPAHKTATGPSLIGRLFVRLFKSCLVLVAFIAFYTWHVM